MGQLILVGLLMYWLTTNTTAELLFLGILLVLGILGSITFTTKKPSLSGASERPRIRIAHP